MTSIERIETELVNRLTNNKFSPISIKMKCNGDVVRITPCGYVPEITNINQVSWYLIDSPSLNLAGSSKLSEVANTIANYATLLDEDVNNLEILKKHLRDYGMNSDWDFVSDFHKDIFGHRPHVSDQIMITWAFSDSKESVRYFKRGIV